MNLIKKFQKLKMDLRRRFQILNKLKFRLMMKLIKKKKILSLLREYVIFMKKLKLN